MPAELVSLDYPPGSVSPSHVLCKAVGERRYAAWLGDKFLGHAIARIDGMWTCKTPHEETFPGLLDRDAALLSLLALHRPVAGSALELFAAPPSQTPSAGQAAARR